MKTLLAALMLFATLSGASLYATGRESDANAPYNIMEASAVSVTVSVGKAGDVDSERTFKVTESTKVTINNLPASAADLKGGMVAAITTAPDGNTATYINAHDPRK
jgi:hypothetical protein